MSQLQSHYKALLVSFIGIFLYILGNHIHVPFLSDSMYQFIRLSPVLEANRFSFFGLGLGPVIMGFFFSELLSFVLPPVSKWRKTGRNGRDKINILALVLSAVLILVTIYSELQNFAISPAQDHGSMFTSSLVIPLIYLFFFTGAVTLFILGYWMTKRGLANGFGVLVVFDIIIYTGKTIFNDVKYFINDSANFYFPGIIFFFLFIWILYYFVFKPKAMTDITFKNKRLLYDVPPVAQGVFAIIWSYNLVLLPPMLWPESSWAKYMPPDWMYTIVFTLLFLVVSLFSYWLAYSSKRLKNNVTISMNSLSEKTYFFTSMKYLLIVVVVSFLLSMPRPFESDGRLALQWISLAYLLLLYFIGKDILEHFMFIRKHSDVATLGEFDNFQYMTVIKKYLISMDIDCLVQGFEFRRLYAFISPIYKMQLLVPRSKLVEAKSLLEIDKVEII